MKHVLLAALMCVLLAAGCQSNRTIETESMQVKRMKVNGTELACTSRPAAGRPSCSCMAPRVTGAHGRCCAPTFRPDTATCPLAADITIQMPGLTMVQTTPSTSRLRTSQSSYVPSMSGKCTLSATRMPGRLVGVLALKYPELLRSVVLGEPGLVPPTSAEGKAALAAFMADVGNASTAAKSGDNRQSAILVANAVLDDANGFSKLPPVRQQRWLDNANTGPAVQRAPAGACDVRPAQGLGDSGTCHSRREDAGELPVRARDADELPPQGYRRSNRLRTVPTFGSRTTRRTQQKPCCPSSTNTKASSGNYLYNFDRSLRARFLI